MAKTDVESDTLTHIDVVENNDVEQNNDATQRDTSFDLEDPNKLLYDFLTEHNLKISVTSINDKTPFVGHGFALLDKPLLVIGVEYK